MFSTIKRRYTSLCSLPWIIKDYQELSRQLQGTSDFSFWKFFPIANEKFEWSAKLMHFYFYQDLYAAQKIFSAAPIKHVDIWSRVDWFIGHVASFRAIEMFDIRPLSEKIRNVSFTQGDLLDLDEKYHDYTDSISSLSVLEHFGLGRYGDKIDAYGHIKGIEAIHHMLTPWGIFYCSVPIWPQRIEFNAHRVFSVRYLIDLFAPLFDVQEFSYIDDQGNFFEEVQLDDAHISTNFWCSFGNGIFVLKKKA